MPELGVAAARSFPPGSRNGLEADGGSAGKWPFCGEALFRTRTGDPFLTIEAPTISGPRWLSQERDSHRTFPQAQRARAGTICGACVPAGFPKHASEVLPEPPEDLCEWAGHEWADAGGGLLICLRCEAEKWTDDEGSGLA